MSSFLRNLFGIVRPTKTTRPARSTGRRTGLRLEHLEDRMVPTGIVTSATNLLVECSPGRVISFAQSPTQPNEMVISDNVQGTVGTVSRSAFKTVEVSVEGSDFVQIDDSNGMPFLRGQTVTFNGAGTNNVVDLFGSRTIDTDARYTVGGTPSTSSTLVEDGLTFNVTSVVAEVIDTLRDTGGPLSVSTGGTGVTLNGSVVLQTLSNLGSGGGGVFTFANKGQVVLNENAAFGQVTLESTLAPAGEQSFTLALLGQNELASVLGTPANFTTNVQAAGSDQAVNVQSSSGVLNIGGGATTDVSLTAAGVQGAVNVNDVNILSLTNTGTAAQDVTVTNSAISGTGFFADASAGVSFQNVNSLVINAGSGADHYTVNALSGPIAKRVEIVDNTRTTSFVDDVFVNSGSHLNLTLANFANADVAALVVHHQGGKAGVSKTSPTATNGHVTVSYPGELPSEVTFDGFASVKTASF